MYADNIDELHMMATRLGLKRTWFQTKSRLPHYDLTVGKRVQAIKMGVVDDHDRKAMIGFLKIERFRMKHGTRRNLK